MLARLCLAKAHTEIYFEMNLSGAQQEIAALKVNIKMKDDMIRDLLDDDVKYTTLLEKKHIEEISSLEEQITKSNQRHKADIKAIAKETLKIVQKDDALYSKVNREHDDIVQNMHAEYTAIIAHKDEERICYKEVIEKLQNTYDNYLTEVYKKYKRDLLGIERRPMSSIS